jgi:ABC-type cobalamin transport system ATPase subunit
MTPEQIARRDRFLGIVARVRAARGFRVVGPDGARASAELSDLGFLLDVIGEHQEELRFLRGRVESLYAADRSISEPM